MSDETKRHETEEVSGDRGVSQQGTRDLGKSDPAGARPGDERGVSQQGTRGSDEAKADDNGDEAGDARGVSQQGTRGPDS